MPMRNPLLCRKASAPAAGLDALASVLQDLLLPEGNDDRAVYLEARHKLRELASGVNASIPPAARRLKNMIRAVRWNIQCSEDSTRSSDYGQAKTWQFLALQKLRHILSVLKGGKLAYGYDISGEMGEMFHGSEEIANRENQKHIDDTAQPFEQHETKPNPANLTRDYQAEKDFPSLRGFKNKRVQWPPRTR